MWGTTKRVNPDTGASCPWLVRETRVPTCFGLEVHGNRVVDNGLSSGPGREGVTVNVGIAALGVYGTLGVEEELMLLGAPRRRSGTTSS